MRNTIRLIGGAKLHIKVQETIYHLGHYRVALAVNSPTELPLDPRATTEPTPNGPRSVSADIQDPVTPPVLADGLFVHKERVQEPGCTLRASAVQRFLLAPVYGHEQFDASRTATRRDADDREPGIVLLRHRATNRFDTVDGQRHALFGSTAAPAANRRITTGSAAMPTAGNARNTTRPARAAGRDTVKDAV